MKHIITLAAAISIAAVSYAQNAPIPEKAFVVVRNGKEVTATYGEKPLTGNSWKDKKDPCFLPYILLKNILLKYFFPINS